MQPYILCVCRMPAPALLPSPCSTHPSPLQSFLGRVVEVLHDHEVKMHALGTAASTSTRDAAPSPSEAARSAPWTRSAPVEPSEGVGGTGCSEVRAMASASSESSAAATAEVVAACNACAAAAAGPPPASELPKPRPGWFVRTWRGLFGARGHKPHKPHKPPHYDPDAEPTCSI